MGTGALFGGSGARIAGGGAQIIGGGAGLRRAPAQFNPWSRTDGMVYPGTLNGLERPKIRNAKLTSGEGTGNSYSWLRLRLQKLGNF